MGQIKTVKDYVGRVHERYPLIPETDIQRILEFGFRHFYLMTTRGADFMIRGGRKGEWFYTYVGRILRNDRMMNQYICIKRAIKYRLRWIRKKVQYDGYRYFSINEEQYNSYLEQKKGKKRPLITFPGDVKLYKIPAEVLAIGDQKNCYVFKVEMPEERPFMLRYKDGTYATKDAIYLGKRGPDGNINYVDENEKRSHKQPYRRHNNRLYTTKRTK